MRSGMASDSSEPKTESPSWSWSISGVYRRDASSRLCKNSHVPKDVNLFAYASLTDDVSESCRSLREQQLNESVPPITNGCRYLLQQQASYGAVAASGAA